MVLRYVGTHMLDYNICQLQLHRNKLDDKLIHNVSAADRIDRPGGLIKTTQRGRFRQIQTVKSTGGQSIINL